MEKSIEKLEEKALQIWSARRKKRNREELKSILRDRQSKLNEQFVFTPENMEKILDLNQRLMNCFEKAKEEGLKLFHDMETRMTNGDPFLQDYEIEANIIPVIIIQNKKDGEWEEPDDGILCLLNELCPSSILNLNIKGGIDTDDIYFKKSLNWNEMVGARNGELDEHYICYAMHELYEHAFYSLQDIIQINTLWVDINVRHQHFVEWYDC
jgi:hypothetical protein